MTPLEQCRDLVLEALINLKAAHAALCDGRLHTAVVKLETGRAALDAARKRLPADIPPQQTDRSIVPEP